MSRPSKGVIETESGPETAVEIWRPQALPALEIPPGVVWKGLPLLAYFLIPIHRLHEDPANANTHNEDSYRAIAASYAEFGQQKHVVCSHDLVVKDGNGQLIAARDYLRWTHLAAAPSNLEGFNLAEYAVAANQTPNLSAFNREILARQIAEFRQNDPKFRPESLGFSESDVSKILEFAKAHTEASVKHDGEGASGFASGDLFTGNYVVSIPLPPGKASDAEFKSQLARLCNAHGLSFKVKPS